MRPHTARRDGQILKLWNDGRMVPKEIMARMRLASVDIVYQAIRRSGENVPHETSAKQRHKANS